MHDAHAAFAHPTRNVNSFGLHPGMRVADFGAGSGAYALAIAEALSGSGVVYAVDIQKDLLRRIKNDAHKRGFNNVEVIWADLEKPGGSKIADRTLDAVLISNLLFQVADKTALFAEARRILRATGRLIVIDWQESFGGMGPLKEAVVTKEAAAQVAAQCGFGDAAEFKAGAHHWGLIFRPKKQEPARHV
jgi:ubiquinone/menaquinone biosynthesis C-methylase UbiE